MRTETEEQLHTLHVEFNRLMDQPVLFPEVQPDRESKLINTRRKIQQKKRKLEKEQPR